MSAVHPWRTVPRRSKIIFLIAVFFVFANIGFANDTMDMGRQAPLRFWLGIVLPGIFAISYAFAGVTLRSQWWKAFAPIFAVQFVVMGGVAMLFPDPPPLTRMGEHELAIRFHSSAVTCRRSCRRSRRFSFRRWLLHPSEDDAEGTSPSL